MTILLVLVKVTAHFLDTDQTPDHNLRHCCAISMMHDNVRQQVLMK